MMKVLKLWLVDLCQGWRDPITALIFFVPVIIGVVGRLGFPFLAPLLPQHSLSWYVDLFMSLLVLMPGLLTGMIAAFLMLDEKDEGTLVAVQVSPLPKMHYALYRLLSPILITAVLVVLLVVIIGVVSVPASVLLLTAVLAALGAPLWAYAIFMASDNKIEGLAVAKLLNLFVCVPLLSVWIPQRFVPVLWFYPLYWPFQFFLSALSQAPPLHLAATWLAGVLVHALFLWILLLRIATRSYA